MKQLPGHIDEGVLTKYFAGQASKEEAARVEAWAGESSDNADLLWQYQVVWSDMGVIRPLYDGGYDVDAAWGRVMKPSRNGRAYPRLIKIAAMMVVSLGLAFLVWTIMPEHLPQIAKAEETILELPLADGSVVVLNQGSSLTYPEVFEKEARQVKLEGEAFFEVEPDEARPFVIEAGTTTIRVLGTAFNVRMDSAGVTVAVSSGKVLFTYRDSEIVLTKGMKGQYTSALGSVQKSRAGASDSDHYWRKKMLRYDGDALPAVVKQLEQVYGVSIQLEGGNFDNCMLSVHFENDPIEEVLEVIALTLNLEVTNTSNQFKLSGKGCDY